MCAYVCRTELNIEGLCISSIQYMHLRLARGADEVCAQRFSDSETFFRNARGRATIDVPMKNAWNWKRKARDLTQSGTWSVCMQVFFKK